MTKTKKECHILSLSGGKDSTALALHIKNTMPNIHEQIEYVFFDTECELRETYDYLNKLEVFLQKPIKRIKPTNSFAHLFEMYKFLPSAKFRWCTIEMKTKTFRKYIHDKIKNGECEKVNLYVGIRADEPSRIENYQKQNLETESGYLKTHYPLADSGITIEDVFAILENEGIGLPDYYTWKSRSGCTFCFFQRKIEWVGLFKRHPDLYKQAMKYEQEGGKNFTWIPGISLEEFCKPENIAEIERKHALKLAKIKPVERNLIDIYADEDCGENNCVFCHI